MDPGTRRETMKRVHRFWQINRRTSGWISLLFLLVFLTAGCGRWTVKDRVLRPPPAEDVEGVLKVGIDRPPEYDYRIGPGDNMLVRFFYYPEMIEPAIEVPSTGIVQFPLIGGIQVIGYSEQELNALLRQKYESRLMFPDVVARITSRRHDSVFVDATLAGQATLPYHSKLTLLDSLKRISMARDSGALHSVIIIRGLNTPQYKSFRINAHKILDGKENDIYLEPNDIVYVPKKFIYDVGYFTKNYIDNVLGQHIMPANVFPQAFPFTGDLDYRIGIDLEDVP